jgi:SCP-2 sterol transfer family protein
VATVDQCEDALHRLAGQLSSSDSSGSPKFDRSLSCRVPDLGVVFAGLLKGGELLDIARTESPSAQIRLTINSDDLLSLVDGGLKVPTAWATGRLKIQASMMDMLRLKSIF